MSTTALELSEQTWCARLDMASRLITGELLGARRCMKREYSWMDAVAHHFF
jgi:hypothetical protein